MSKTPTNMNHRSGFVNLFGNPNVGKSTLLNTLLDHKIAITNRKAQTTRHRIIGILNGKDHQIVFSDTPGIITPKYDLQKVMMTATHSIFEDADVLVGVINPKQTDFKNESFKQKLQNNQAPLIFAINKIDLTDNKQLEEIALHWQKKFPKSIIIPISAKEKFGLDILVNQIKRHLPIAPPYYEKDALTDKPEKFFVSEIVREKILSLYDQEIPYAVDVITESFKELENIIHISCLIAVERKSQKGILIGKNGEALKKMATHSRLELEKFFNKKVFIRLHLKVVKKWRNDTFRLKDFGYTNS